jgi:hypothetical protein
MDMAAKANSPKKRHTKTRKSPWSRLKVSLSKNLFDQNITEIRTLQNEVIGTINTLGGRRFQVSNYKNEKVFLPSFDDSRTFILSCYFFAGRQEDPLSGLQLHMF